MEDILFFQYNSQINAPDNTKKQLTKNKGLTLFPDIIESTLNKQILSSFNVSTWPSYLQKLQVFLNIPREDVLLFTFLLQTEILNNFRNSFQTLKFLNIVF